MSSFMSASPHPTILLLQTQKKNLLRDLCPSDFSLVCFSSSAHIGPSGIGVPPPVSLLRYDAEEPQLSLPPVSATTTKKILNHF